MAKKKRPLPKRQQAAWPPSDVITLLAWLDHTLNHKELNFENTVAAHLHHIYTLPQINRKLAKLWGKCGPPFEPGLPHSTWRDDLFSLGSTCLNGIEDIRKEDIANARDALEKDYRSSNTSSVTRRLRSASRTIGRPLSRQAATSTSPKNACTLQKQNLRPPSTPLTPSGIKREIEQTEPSAEEHSAAKKRRLTLSERVTPARSITLEEEPFNRQRKENENSKTSHILPLHVVEDSDDELSEILSVDLEDYGKPKDVTRCMCGATDEQQGLTEELNEGNDLVDWAGCTRCLVWQHQECIKNSLGIDFIPEDYCCELCRPEAHKRITGQRLSSLDVDEASTGPAKQGSVLVLPTLPEASLRSSPNSTTTFENSAPVIDKRLENATEKIKDLEEDLVELKLDLNDRDVALAARERELSSLRAARKQRDEQSRFPIEELIERNLNVEKTLLASFKVREEGMKFTTLTATSREWFGATKVDEGFCDIYSQSRQTLCRRDDDTVPFIPTLCKHDSLHKLASKCLLISAADTHQAQEGMHKLSKFGLEAMVRALINSAIAEWVFETDFPHFDDSHSDVLLKYRELLATQDGVVALRNLDLAARTALTKSYGFRQQRIPDTAKSLAIKLSQTLAPLFSDTPNSAEESDWDGFATWRDDKDEWMDRRKRFTQMFIFALETKADSCLNIQDYEMLIFAPGTRFDKRTMQVETNACALEQKRNHDGKVVDLCIEAAVFAHGRKPLSEDSSVAEATVPSKNFVYKDGKDRFGIEPAVKAVVVLADKVPVDKS